MSQLPASERPEMTNRSCTPPSGELLNEPSGFRENLNRASRTGPSAVMKDGSTLSAPSRLKTCVSGFGPMNGNTDAPGLVPPTSGCAWQLEHWFVLNRGPRPLFVPFWTTSTSWNRASPLAKNSGAPGVWDREASGWPASTVPPRTPGSLAGWGGGDWATMTPTNHRRRRHAIHRFTRLLDTEHRFVSGHMLFSLCWPHVRSQPNVSVSARTAPAGEDDTIAGYLQAAKHSRTALP